MSAAWPCVSLGELIRLERRPVDVVADHQYQEIGTYSYGRGIFHKTPRSGLEVGNKDLFLMKEGDVILQITFAWEGAIALCSKADDGLFGSVRYPTFRVNEERCFAPFLVRYLCTRDGLEQIGRICPGSAGRNRVLAIKRLPEVMVPLPPLGEQRCIVARIEELAAKVSEARRLRDDATAKLTHFIRAADGRFFAGPVDKRVRDYVRFQTGYAFKSDWFVPTGIRVARNANVSHGHLDWSDTVRVPEGFQAEFARFVLKKGDILVSLDRPLISTGVKIARVSEDDLPCLLLQRVARAIFLADGLDPDYFFAWLRSSTFAAAIDPGRSNGVPHISHKDIEAIPFDAPNRRQQRSVVAELDALHAKVDAVKTLQEETAAELHAMVPAILDKAFKGEL